MLFQQKKTGSRIPSHLIHDKMCRMAVQVTEAGIDDFEKIQNVFYRTWLVTYPNKEHGISVDDIEDRFKDRNAPERREKRRQDILTRNLNKRLLVAKDGDTVVGVCRASKSESENRLNAIYVLPEYQGKGVGSRLWAEISSFFDQDKEVVIDVVTYNQNAIDFYKKLGFMDTGKRFFDEQFRLKSGAQFPEMEMRRSFK